MPVVIGQDNVIAIDTAMAIYWKDTDLNKKVKEEALVIHQAIQQKMLDVVDFQNKNTLRNSPEFKNDFVDGMKTFSNSVRKKGNDSALFQ